MQRVFVSTSLYSLESKLANPGHNVYSMKLAPKLRYDGRAVLGFDTLSWDGQRTIELQKVGLFTSLIATFVFCH